jgi:hypothetical protein
MSSAKAFYRAIAIRGCSCVVFQAYGARPRGTSILARSMGRTAGEKPVPQTLPWPAVQLRLENVLFPSEGHLTALASIIAGMLLGYWQPVVQCKNPECFFGKPTFLPYPNLPRKTEDPPNWPEDDWKAFLICRHCGHGDTYSKEDVEWGGGQNKNGLPNNSLVLYVELQCAEKCCPLPVRLYLGCDDSKRDKHRDSALLKGSVRAMCEAGHVPKRPLSVIRSIFVNRIDGSPFADNDKRQNTQTSLDRAGGKSVLALH